MAKPIKHNNFKLRGVVHLLVFGALLCSIIILVFNWPSHKLLATTIETSATSFDSSHPINKKIELLSIKHANVDNDFREFLVTKDADTYKKYQKGLKEMIATVDSIDTYTNAEPYLSSIKKGFKTKDSISNLLIALHTQMDTLLSFNPEDHSHKSHISIAPYDLETVLNSIEVDTVKSLEKSTRRGLLGRLSDAFRKKKNIDLLKETITIKMRFGKKRAYSGSFLEQLEQLGTEVNNYYKNAFNRITQKQELVKARELQLVYANKYILTNMDKLLASFKLLGAEADRNIHQQSSANAIDAAENLKRIISILLSLLVVALLLLLLYSYLASSHVRMLAEEKKKSDTQASVKEYLLATMSHEIRTPLNSIIGFTSLLQKEKMPPSSGEMVDSISFSSNSLLNIINSTLDYLKTEKGMMKLATSVFNPFDEIQKTTKLLTVLAQKKKIGFTIENIATTNTWLLGDVNKLHQLIYNLSGNAIKFTTEGTVSIKASLQQRPDEKFRLTIAITDTGSGIKQEELPKIFDHYYQAENSAATTGTGLGLAICKEMVEMQKGNISATSKIGVGSTFTFYIDYEKAATDTLSKQETNTALIKSNKTIFIVDDDIFQLAWIKRAFENAGFHCISFDGGEQALAMLGQLTPDLVFTDINMPGMDGLTLLQEIQSHKDLSIKVIACTGDDDKQHHLQYKQSGFAAILVKPFTEADLLKIVNELT